MKYIISATNRPQSNSFVVAQIVQKIYQNLKAHMEIISLQDVPFQSLISNPYPAVLPKEVKNIILKLNKSAGFVIVCPEYNGSFPGIFKFFIDHWSYPETFEYRPVAFVGLGGRFGALRAVEQLQQIMGYRNGFIYPERVFLQNISEQIVQGEIKDREIKNLLCQQAEGFLKFISALEEKGLSSRTRQQHTALSPDKTNLEGR